MVAITAGLWGGFVATFVMTAVRMGLAPDAGPPPSAAVWAKYIELASIPGLGVLLTVPSMVVAIATAVPSWKNVSVFLAGFLVVGTERRVLAAGR